MQIHAPLLLVSKFFFQASENEKCFFVAPPEAFGFLLEAGGRAQITDVFRSLPTMFEKSVNVKAKSAELVKNFWPKWSADKTLQKVFEKEIKHSIEHTKKQVAAKKAAYPTEPTNFYMGVKFCLNGMNSSTFGL